MAELLFDPKTGHIIAAGSNGFKWGVVEKRYFGILQNDDVLESPSIENYRDLKIDIKKLKTDELEKLNDPKQVLVITTSLIEKSAEEKAVEAEEREKIARITAKREKIR